MEAEFPANANGGTSRMLESHKARRTLNYEAIAEKPAFFGG
jgi:hypothetical protein